MESDDSTAEEAEFEPGRRVTPDWGTKMSWRRCRWGGVGIEVGT
jgi:hypothetical protein